MNSRRNKFDIIADILRLAGVGTSEIMDTASLNYVQLQHYLSSLMEGDFIVQSSGAHGRATYRLTSKGCELLKRIEAVREMLSSTPS